MRIQNLGPGSERGGVALPALWMTLAGVLTASFTIAYLKAISLEGGLSELRDDIQSKEPVGTAVDRYFEDLQSDEQRALVPRQEVSSLATELETRFQESRAQLEDEIRRQEKKLEEQGAKIESQSHDLARQSSSLEELSPLGETLAQARTLVDRSLSENREQTNALAAMSTHLESIEKVLASWELKLDAHPDREDLERLDTEVRQRMEVLREKVEAEITKLQLALPNLDQIEKDVLSQVAAHLARQRREETERSRRLLASSSDWNRFQGLSRLFRQRPDDISAIVTRFVTTLDPERFPVSTESILALTAESGDADLESLFLGMVFSGVNPALSERGLDFLGTLDLRERHAHLGGSVLTRLMSEDLIHDPPRFNAIIRVLQSLFGERPTPQAFPQSVEDVIADGFMAFFKNYLGSRVVGYDPGAPRFPFASLSDLNNGRCRPSLSPTNRTRSVFLSRIASSPRIRKKAATFVLGLVQFVGERRPTADGSTTDFLVEVLKTLTEQDYGRDWRRWSQWVKTG